MKYTERKVTSQDSPLTRTLTLANLPDFKDTYTYYPPEINPGLDRVFPAPKLRKWKIAPPYNKSFKKVLQEREIKMTNYSVGEIEETWSLVSIDRVATSAQMRTWYSCRPLKDGGATRATDGVIVRNTYYQDNYDLIRAVDSFPAVEYTDSPTPEDIHETLNDLKAKVVQDSYSGFDALTELAEFPETLGMLRDLFLTALRPLQGIKALQERYKRARRRGKTHTEAHGEIASQWMQYRYGIMPLVYSIQDLVKLLDEAFAEFKTDRAFAVLTSKPLDRSRSENTHVAIYRSHEVKITAIGKARYSSQSSRLMDLISINPFLTAWELIPMSFVIDWFINVGDLIGSHTASYGDLAEERKFCYSIRRTTIDKHVLRYNFTDGITYTKHQSFPCNGGFVKFDGEYSNERQNIGEKVLYERREESYERMIFQPNTIEFNFGPDLGWMRMLDGYVLSFNKIGKLLKKLR